MTIHLFTSHNHPKEFYMMSILTEFATAEAKALFEKQNGNYNEYPPYWREIDAATFAKSAYFTYSPVRMEYRQMLRRLDDKPPESEVAVAAHLNWMHDNTGFAIVADFWGGIVKFYTFGCEHQYVDPTEELKRRGITLFAMQHATFCGKCGWLGQYDSSD